MQVITLPSRLVVVSGISGTGKSTTLDEVVKLVANSFILEKDGVNQGMLHAKAEEDRRLPPFKDYVRSDSVFPDHARNVQTPFGEMIQVDPVNGFYGRHVRDQTYIVIANIASMNMAVGKIPFIDCMTIRQLRDDTVRRFMEQPAFVGYPRYLVHFVCEEDECYQRCVRRAQTDPHAAVRDAKKIVSREAFHKFVTEEQPMLPKELARYKHLVINTSEGNPTECAEKLIEYIQNEN